MFRKEGKLFGKISIIDVLVVVLILALAVGLFLRFSNTAVTDFSRNSYEYEVRVDNIRDYTVAALEKGGEVYDQNTKEYLGTIVSVRQEPGEAVIPMADGSYKTVVAEDRYAAYVTVSFTGRENNGGYYTDTNQQIAVGETLLMNAKGAKCTGNITKVYQK